jgi:hypothetical protein
VIDQRSPDDLRAALQAGPDGGFGPVNVAAVIRKGRRRRGVRRAVAAAAALGVVAAIGVAAGLISGSGPISTVPPAGESTVTAPPSADERHAALVHWANCLRDARIPGVTVVGPAPGSDHISYLDENGDPLPSNYRETSGEWGSAAESCAAKVPALMPELEQQWDMIRAEGTSRTVADYDGCLADHGLSRPVDRRRAEAVGCHWNPWDLQAERILHCPRGELQSGLRGIYERGPWVDSPEAAGQVWLARQTDRDTFTTVTPEPGDASRSRLHVLDHDGNTTGILYLLNVPRMGWRLQGENVCQ